MNFPRVHSTGHWFYKILLEDAVYWKSLGSLQVGWHIDASEAYSSWES